MRTNVFLTAGIISLLGAGVACAQSVVPEARTLASTLLGRAATDDEAKTPQSLWDAVERHDEMLADWLRQDLNLAPHQTPFENAACIDTFLKAASTVSGQSQISNHQSLIANLSAYRAACAERRARRLAPVKAGFPRR